AKPGAGPNILLDVEAELRGTGGVNFQGLGMALHGLDSRPDESRSADWGVVREASQGSDTAGFPRGAQPVVAAERRLPDCGESNCGQCGESGARVWRID